MTMANEKLTPAPKAEKCEAGGGSCGAGQPLYTVNGLVFCEHHADWPNSKEGRKVAAIKTIDKEGA
jgi:hypothetical protein